MIPIACAKIHGLYGICATICNGWRKSNRPPFQNMNMIPPNKTVRIWKRFPYRPAYFLIFRIHSSDMLLTLRIDLQTEEKSFR